MSSNKIQNNLTKLFFFFKKLPGITRAGGCGGSRLAGAAGGTGAAGTTGAAGGTGA